MNTYTGLQSIRLQNYRCFSDLTVELDRHMTVLVANNGAGKTTVLDAIAVVLGDFLRSFQQEKRPVQISEENVRLKVIDHEIFEMAKQLPCLIEAKGDIVGESAERQIKQGGMNMDEILNSLDFDKIAKALRNKIAHGDDSKAVVLPVIAYYGTGRLWGERVSSTDKGDLKTDFLSRTSGYKDCLESVSNYGAFAEWFRYTTEAHLQLRNQNIERHGEKGLRIKTPYQTLINGVNTAIEICLSDTGWSNLRYSSIHQQLVVEHKENGLLPVKQLSDGIRNMIALVADIAHHAVRLNKQFKENAPAKSPGIILIDEVDMHLHPAWQQRVLAQLRKAFPSMQFIVTTHSPQVLSTVSRKHIRLLTKNIDNDTIAAIPLAESYARSNADVLETVMHVDAMPTVKESPDLKRYNDMIEQGDLLANETQALRETLEATLGANHPELMRLDTVKRRRELLG